ncbi:HNH endonuclease [Flavobacterium gillisiae]|uniref:HNH endonuclease n=1 Tax=Flavobacterium gillisiae TaxID=150146 RepID=A0A1H4FXM3_9FLAO|nr:HNH endonuclease signature motif containing protein [Flavobacterium gillisiae]SEB02103.1 HNH endonuclease [Flavobacterium gillisiae]
MNEREYFEISENKKLPARCPILEYCTRRAYTLYFLNELKGGENKSIVEILQKNDLLKSDFDEKSINLAGEIPSYINGKQYKVYENFCPEVNLFDSIGFRHSQNTASISGEWDDLRNDKFKNFNYRHYSECAEFSKIHYEKNTSKRNMTEKRKNPTYRQKVRLLQESKNKCAFCDFSDAGRIQFHHIDENSANTILENLISVCPNCHSLIGEKAITEDEVLIKKSNLKNEYLLEDKANKSNIEISNSTFHNPILGNNNVVNLTVKNQMQKKKVIQKYPEGSIGQNIIMYNYSKYLADRYSEFKNFELKPKGQEFNYASFYGKVKKDFKSGGFFHIPQTRFLELTSYLQKNIDRTILAKVNKSKGVLKNYSSFEDYELQNK